MCPIITLRIITRLLPIMLLLLAPATHAQDTDDASGSANPVKLKFTPSYYDNSDGSSAYDLNLRADFGDQRAWIGEYHDSHGYNQARAGFDAVTQVGFVNLDFSGQYATGGFVGGSVTSQVGGDTYAILGWGRTDLHPYYNLNFDPNDALTAGFGTKSLVQNLEVQLYHIWDDRTPSKQHVTHLLSHYDRGNHEHVSIDVSYKHGLSDPQTYVKGYAMTLTYAWQRVFARLAYDQHANFAVPNQTRLSVGLLF